MILFFLTCVLYIFISMGKRKITFENKVDLRAGHMTRVVEFVEKEPIRDVITALFEGDFVASGGVPLQEFLVSYNTMEIKTLSRIHVKFKKI